MKKAQLSVSLSFYLYLLSIPSLSLQVTNPVPRKDGPSRCPLRVTLIASCARISGLNKRRQMLVALFSHFMQLGCNSRHAYPFSFFESRIVVLTSNHSDSDSHSHPKSRFNFASTDRALRFSTSVLMCSRWLILISTFVNKLAFAQLYCVYWKRSTAIYIHAKALCRQRKSERYERSQLQCICTAVHAQQASAFKGKGASYVFSLLLCCWVIAYKRCVSDAKTRRREKKTTSFRLVVPLLIGKE